MISNHNIICFGFAEWDNPYKTNQHHLMEKLSQKNRVLFIESLGLRQPSARSKDIKRMIRRVFKWLRGTRMASETVYIFSPLVLPFHKFRSIRLFNNILLSLQLNYVVSRYKFQDPIIWSYIPNAVEFLGRWNEKLSVYHCVDELAANPRIPAEVVRKAEEEFIRKANVTFVTAKPLFEEKRKYSDSVYYMPNVADYAHFGKARDRGTDINPGLMNIPKPRLGFIGAISNYKIDMELLQFLASSHPEWSIVMIGATGEGEAAADLNEISSNRNIHFLGGKKYGELPGFIKGFDVCLLPNRINEYTKNMFPMKFFEYLASGKPIVSTELEALKDFSELAYFSKDHREFAANVEKALRESGSDIINKRVETAKLFTWDNRIEEMSLVIKGKLNER